jgi:GTPase SAR1 family protein
MFDLTDSKSFQDLKMWLKEIKHEIKKSKIPKIIIANKYDLIESGQK